MTNFRSYQEQMVFRKLSSRYLDIHFYKTFISKYFSIHSRTFCQFLNRLNFPFIFFTELFTYQLNLCFFSNRAVVAIPFIYIAAVFLLPIILAHGSGFVQLDCCFSFFTLRFRLYENGLSPFFLLKPFLTFEVGTKVCEVSSTDVELEDFFSDSNICLISLKGLESIGESTGPSPSNLSVVPLISFPYFQVEEQMFPLEYYQVDSSTNYPWLAFDRDIELLCD